MSSTEPHLEEQALGWVIRLKEARAEDWAEFTQWLETSPAHAAAFDEMAMLDEEIGRLPRRKPPELTAPRAAQPSPHSRRWSAAGWGAAAAAMLAMGYVSLHSPRPADASYVVATAAGERRSIALPDGSRIDLNGSTRIVLDREQPRLARLEQGEALFKVIHDENAPFQVRAGDDLIWDVGTLFNVVNSGSVVRVAVAEGAVVFNPKSEKVSLSPGMSLEKQGGSVEVRRGEAAAAGAWKEGRLVYADARIATIAADLSRSLGIAVRAAPAVADRTFSGVLKLDGDPQAVLGRAASLLGVRAERLSEGWIFSSE